MQRVREVHNPTNAPACAQTPWAAGQVRGISTQQQYSVRDREAASLAMHATGAGGVGDQRTRDTVSRSADTRASNAAT